MTRTLLRGGVIRAPGAPDATALCTEGERVVWVGTEERAERYADGAEQVLDLAGRFVAPAFVDAHSHAAQTGLHAVSLYLGGCRSLGEALAALARYARDTNDPVVLGFGWDETHWPEGRPFTQAEVDRAVGGRLAYLARVDVHSAVVSSAFVDRSPQLRDLEGWDPDGRVARAAHHRARDLTNELVPDGQWRDAISRGLALAAAAGIGSVHEIGAPHLSRPTDFATIAELGGEQPLPTVVGYWGELGAVEKAQELGCAGAAGDLCVDGAVGSRTAATFQRYADADTYGHCYLEAEEIRDHVLACTHAGLQAGFHCIGDRAISETLAGFDAAADAIGDEAMVAARHRLEHVEMLDADGIALLRRLGIIASIQPAFDAAWGGVGGMYAGRLGAPRALAMNPFRSLADAGVVLAFGSDTPVTPFDPWGAVRAATCHSNEDQRIPAEDAFAAHTVGGWRAAGRDHPATLHPGAPATYAVWDVMAPLETAELPLPALAADLPLPACVRTVVDGQVVYEVEGALE